jgi:PKD domain
MRFASIHRSRMARTDSNPEGMNMTRDAIAPRRGRALATAFLGLLVAQAGCGLDKVTVPELNGPSTLALSLLVHINPDVLVANAVSTASVVATLQGPDGRPVGGRAVFFEITDATGLPAAIGQLGPTSDRVPNNRGPEVTEVTGSDGVAQVIYRVPERIDFNTVTRILIRARLVGSDANSYPYQSVALELRPAEARTFPENPKNTPPVCSFIISPVLPAYKVGEVMRMESTSTDADGRIVRYFWDFGDGTSEDGKTEVDKAYSKPGGYTVTHVCTDNNGAQTPVMKTVNIVP